ncbi:hypothetical protein [Acrocarpospora sp. B8E8]|uniref:hypothetical protein n=1 Tax=Acrocarpospora sp. B8E8 TaxID=3153572 RepID=UPI00325DBE94
MAAELGTQCSAISCWTLDMRVPSPSSPLAISSAVCSMISWQRILTTALRGPSLRTGR